MAHYAQLDENNVVTQVIVVSNDVLIDNGVERGELGVQFCESHFGGKWVQTSYNGKFRTRYAMIGYTYNPSYDAFIPPKPRKNTSFVIDPAILDWVPPVPRPTDDVYKWNEDLVTWLRVPKPHLSWTAQGAPLKWVAPIPYPNDGETYQWSEATQNWVAVRSE
jgi:hypothetical protein